MFQVIVTPKAQKQFNHLPYPDQSKVKRKLSVLENNPNLGKKLSGELAELRVVRAWPYRIIYYITGKKIFITAIIHRQGAY